MISWSNQTARDINRVLNSLTFLFANNNTESTRTVIRVAFKRSFSLKTEPKRSWGILAENQRSRIREETQQRQITIFRNRKVEIWIRLHQNEEAIRIFKRREFNSLISKFFLSTLDRNLRETDRWIRMKDWVIRSRDEWIVFRWRQVRVIQDRYWGENTEDLSFGSGK